MIKIGVVLPYYQREKGLLHSALLSVVNQDLPPDVRLMIVVVDDASPLPPDEDLAQIPASNDYSLTVLRQSNGGPGAARNTALDHFDKELVDFVAFLDTDDTWLPHHLATALASLGDDADYFFANHDRDTFEGGQAYFDLSPVVQSWLSLGEDSPFEPTGQSGLLRFKPSERLAPFMKDYLSQTSTVVYRHSALGKVRFDTTLRTAGEDLLFWLSLADIARRIVFTTRVGAVCGSGVNIFHSTLTWDHPNTPGRFAYQMMLWRYVEERFELSSEELAIVRWKIAGFERGFSYIWLRSLVKSGKPNTEILGTLRSRLGWKAWRIVPSMMGNLRRRAARKQMFPEH